MTLEKKSGDVIMEHAGAAAWFRHFTQMSSGQMVGFESAPVGSLLSRFIIVIGTGRTTFQRTWFSFATLVM
jgi:hypothetical protein